MAKEEEKPLDTVEEKPVDAVEEEPAEQSTNPVIDWIDANVPELADASEAEKLTAAADALNASMEFNDRMEELYENEPEIGELLTAIIKDKKTFKRALAEIVPPEELADFLDNSGDEDVVAERKKYLADRTEKKERAKLIAANAAESEKHVNTWLEKKADWSPEKKQDFLVKVKEIVQALDDGLLTGEELDMFENAFYSEDKIKEATELARVQGRNEKIDDELLKKEAEVTDGLPAMKDSGAVKEKKKGYFDDIAVSKKVLDDFR